ncbi:DsbA family protein [Limimaricola cinnabarinus]|jgi:protein-disulfide isomerase|uniref:Disulfide bond formation protein DsbA n=1 Tax=Limimaricola cinnabarinus TaxID=1125964 RepID=A0A2G1MF75_9RHOB|nr:DsbA family protein [Limimaricola cinnabarinus]PHP27398.1 disulfide bond formation protein DsbA [Limimaricola cinnabarinus]
MTKLTRRTALTGGLLALGGTALWTATRPSAQAQDGAMHPTIEEVMFDPANPVLGNPEGDVTIVEFFDYQCPYCKSNHPVLKEVVEADGNVRLVMKDWPIFGAPSVRAAQLALGAASLDSYLTANDALMATEGRLDETLIEETLTEAGLDVAALDAAYRENRSTWDGLLTRNSAQAAAFHLRGTPAFIIGTAIYPGAMDKAGLENAVATARG